MCGTDSNCLGFSGIELDLFFLCGGQNRLRFCVPAELLRFNIWIESNLVFSVGIEVDLFFVCGPKMTAF